MGFFFPGHFTAMHIGHRFTIQHGFIACCDKTFFDLLYFLCRDMV